MQLPGGGSFGSVLLEATQPAEPAELVYKTKFGTVSILTATSTLQLRNAYVEYHPCKAGRNSTGVQVFRSLRGMSFATTPE